MTKCLNFSDILPKIGDLNDRGTNWKTLYTAEGEFHDIIFKCDTTDVDFTSPENIESPAKCYAILNSDLSVLDGFEVVIRKDHATLTNKVKLMSMGKGSARFVGRGMLTGSALEPSPNCVRSCLFELWGDGCAGILGIVPEEHRMCFGIAAERARCDGVCVDLVTVESPDAPLVYKLAGAMAQAGFNMKSIYVSLRKIRISTAVCHLSNGVAHVSNVAIPVDNKETKDFRKAVSAMLDSVLRPTRSSGSYVAMVNSFTESRLFLYVVVREIAKQAAQRGLILRRLIAGHFLPGTHGFSLSLLLADEGMVALIDSVDGCQVWPRLVYRSTPAIVPGPPALPPPPPLKAVGPSVHKDFTEVPILFCCRVLICSKDLLNKLDVKNEFGNKLMPAINVLLKRTHLGEILLQRPFNVFYSISCICEEYIKSEFSEILNIFFSGCSQAFLSYPKPSEVEWHMLTEALALGVNSVKAYTSFQKKRFCFTEVLEEFHISLEELMKAENAELIKSLGEALEVAQRKLEETHNIQSLEKKDGLPEVSMQAVLVLLISVVEGIKVVHSNHYPQKKKKRKFISE